MTRYDKIQNTKLTIETAPRLEGSLYAILFNSRDDTGLGHNDICVAYRYLIERGTASSNIIVAEENRLKNRFANFPATRKNLESSIDSIRQRARYNDKLFMYISSHGRIVNRECFFGSDDGQISEKDFEKMIQELPVNFALFHFSPCYSGVLRKG